MAAIVTSNRISNLLAKATPTKRTVAQILATARVVSAPVDPLALASRIEAMTVRAADSGQRRAKPGGEFGANGEWYEGGKWIANTDDAKKHKPTYKKTGKQEIGPYKWEVLPEGKIALWPTLAGIEIYDRASDKFTFNPNLSSYLATPEAIANRKNKIELYNAGHRSFAAAPLVNIQARDLAARIKALAVKATAANFVLPPPAAREHNDANLLHAASRRDEPITAARPLPVSEKDTSVPDTTEATRKAHDRARAAAEAIYLAAMLAAAAKLKGEKDKRTRDAAILLLLLLAGEEAYAKTYTALEKAAPTAPEAGQTPTPPVSADTLEAEAASFAESRQPLLRDFADRVADRMEEAEDEATAPEADEKTVLKAVQKVATEESRVMVDIETTAALGTVELQRLKRAGFTTAIWNQIDRPTKRHTHALNMEMGPQPLGTLYPNGQTHPGDPAGGIEECVNCLCYLEGASRKATA